MAGDSLPGSFVTQGRMPPLPLGDLPLGVGAAAGFFLAPISTPETRLAETLLIETAEVATSASVQL